MTRRLWPEKLQNKDFYITEMHVFARLHVQFTRGTFPRSSQSNLNFYVDTYFLFFLELAPQTNNNEKIFQRGY